MVNAAYIDASHSGNKTEYCLAVYSKPNRIVPSARLQFVSAVKNPRQVAKLSPETTAFRVS